MSEIIASTYEIVREIGAGGGGVAYLANHLRLQKKVVLKADKRKIKTRSDLLRREVDVLKELHHAYIPQVYDYFIENNIAYTVIDYIEGESLDKLISRGERFSQAQVITWARQLLEALDYLHSPIHGFPPRGYVHSDIKPANIMRKPNNDICLIDFNIALALGEENVIGCSRGYASPEHYGLDFSSDRKVTAGREDKSGTETEIIPMARVQRSNINRSSSAASIPSASYSKKTIIPDVRSDIYSLGATLYHLLSGERPSHDATKVILLSKKEFSPQIVEIIAKAMNPNPDLRYQSAREMLDALSHLYQNDIRAKRWRRRNWIIYPTCAALLSAGIFCSFVGLKRMQTKEQWLKLAEYSGNALEEGNSALAVNYALQSLSKTSDLFEPDYISEGQKALTDALGVYDLSDGYKTHQTIELPSQPLYMSIAPDGSSVACIYAYSVAIFDTKTCEIIVTLPTEKSALSEVKYLNNTTIVYAGEKGITAYDISRNTELWTGNAATTISISNDGKRVAAICRTDTFATIYDVEDGRIVATLDFKGRHQQVATNDSFLNPNNNIFSLNQDGSKLGVSFADGSVELIDVYKPAENIILIEEDSDYTHFEGGFYQQYFAFSASNTAESIFSIIDTKKMEQTGGFQSDSTFGVTAEDWGICVQTENILVDLHPVTGDQHPLVTTAEDIHRFASDGEHTVIATKAGFLFFDGRANEIDSYKNRYSSDFLQIANGVAVIGSMNSSIVRILTYEDHPNTEVFTYDPSYVHDEARVSEDKKTEMLFSYDQFRVFNMNGNLISEVAIPDADQVYDQQYIRDENGSKLEVTYYDGKIVAYSAEDGSVLYENKGKPPSRSLYEEFETSCYRIKSDLHGPPEIYERETDKFLFQLTEDAYLTYVTEMGNYIIAQYITADGYYFGDLMNANCEILAKLPYLCDVMGETLFFDYPSGDVRQSKIYEIDELLEIAQKEKGETRNDKI